MTYESRPYSPDDLPVALELFGIFEKEFSFETDYAAGSLGWAKDINRFLSSAYTLTICIEAIPVGFVFGYEFNGNHDTGQFVNCWLGGVISRGVPRDITSKIYKDFINHLFTSFNLSLILATIKPYNTAARRATMRQGLSKLAVLPSFFGFGDDAELYGITQEEFVQCQAVNHQSQATHQPPPILADKSPLLVSKEIIFTRLLPVAKVSKIFKTALQMIFMPKIPTFRQIRTISGQTPLPSTIKRKML